MKTTKSVLLFYNSILIISLVTIGLATQSYSDLTPTLLLIPVGTYFIFSLANNFFKFSHLFDNPSLTNFRRILRLYSLGITVLLIFANLAASSSFFQSSMTIILLPLLVSFVLEMVDKKNISQFKLKKIISIAKIFNSNRKELKSKSKLKKGVVKKGGGKNLSEAKKVASSDLEAIDTVAEGEILEGEEAVVASEVIESDSSNEVYAETEEVSEEEAEDLVNVKDGKRRQFLKIIGGGGVSLFLMLFVFKDKASAAFFGSAPGPGVVSVKNIAGDKIDPAEKQPTDGYNISEIDDSSSPAYYGFVHQNGAWYIAREDSSGAYRYISGASSFSTSWTDRATLTYDYFDNIF